MGSNMSQEKPANERQKKFVEAAAQLAQYCEKDFPRCRQAHEDLIAVGKEASKDIRSLTTKVGISKSIGGGAAIVGGVVAAAAIVVAPYAAVPALYCAAGGAGLATAGGLTASASDIAKAALQRAPVQKVKEAEELVKAEMKQFMEVVNKVRVAGTNLTDSDWKDIQALRIEDAAKIVGWLGDVGIMLKSGKEAVKALEIVKSLTSFWSHSQAVFVGATGIAEGVTAPARSLPVIGALSVGSVGAKLVAGASALLSVGLGIYSVIEGAGEISASQLADKIDQAVSEVETQLKDICNQIETLGF